MTRMPFKGSPVWMPLHIAGWVLLASAAVFGGGAALFGGVLAWELLAGLSSPEVARAAASPILAWVISVLGYVLVPSVIGLLVAAVTDITMKSRFAPLEQRLREAERYLELPTHSALPPRSRDEELP